MNFTPVFLWSDLLLFALVAVCIFYGRFAARHAHLRAPWAKVKKNAAGMAAVTVLIPFVLIGLLDSLHYRPILETTAGTAKASFSVEVKSVLDIVAGAALGKMIGKSERTYSAPLATHGFSKETVELPGLASPGNTGKTDKQTREYPRLASGGRHLQNPVEEHGRDLVIQTARGSVLGALVWLVLALALMAAASVGVGVAGVGAGVGTGAAGTGIAQTWRATWRGETETPWRAILITLLLLCMLGGIAITLGSRYHLMGTDKVGQDVFYLALKSIRTALMIGTLTTLVMLPLGVLLGIAAGYLRGWVDDLIQYLYTTLNSIPGVLLIAASVLMMQVYIEANPQLFQTAVERADFRLLALCFILGVMSWTGLCRLLRGEALKLRELEYVQAARAFGVSHFRIIVRHLLPNVMHLVIISAVMDFSGMVLTEAVLSYVGVGVDPAMNSFGSMINAARLEMSRDPMVWWALAASFFFMFTLVLAANLFADAVRDAFDPRLVVKRPRLAFLGKAKA